jgi:hypothetical protein
MIVEALEPEQLPLGTVDGADDLKAYALIGMVPAFPSRARTVWRTPVDVAILKCKADRATRDLSAADVHRRSPLIRSGARAGFSYLRHRSALVKRARARSIIPFHKLAGRAYASANPVVNPACRGGIHERIAS